MPSLSHKFVIPSLSSGLNWETCSESGIVRWSSMSCKISHNLQAKLCTTADIVSTSSFPPAACWYLPFVGHDQSINLAKSPKWDKTSVPEALILPEDSFKKCSSCWNLLLVFTSTFHSPFKTVHFLLTIYPSRPLQMICSIRSKAKTIPSPFIATRKSFSSLYLCSIYMDNDYHSLHSLFLKHHFQSLFIFFIACFLEGILLMWNYLILELTAYGAFC